MERKEQRRRWKRAEERKGDPAANVDVVSCRREKLEGSALVERSFLVLAKRGLDSRPRREREDELLVFLVVTVSRALNFPVVSPFSRATRALSRLEMKSAPRLETDLCYSDMTDS
ncbi:unnamed protein product [Lasius platythorax]|uniref:Uncharacterized protein n=1 Tax=Lasius platythorax TaxID=488582 RepID=A0AAV2ND77_9HYME